MGPSLTHTYIIVMMFNIWFKSNCDVARCYKLNHMFFMITSPRTHTQIVNAFIFFCLAMKIVQWKSKRTTSRRHEFVPMRSRGALNADCLRAERLAAGCSLLGFSTLTDMQPHALLFGCTKQSDCMRASALRCTIGHLSSTAQTVHMVHFGVNIPADTMTHWLPADSQNNPYYQEFQIGNTWTGFFKI